MSWSGSVKNFLVQWSSVFPFRKMAQDVPDYAHIRTHLGSPGTSGATQFSRCSAASSAYWSTNGNDMRLRATKIQCYPPKRCPIMTNLLPCPGFPGAGKLLWSSVYWFSLVCMCCNSHWFLSNWKLPLSNAIRLARAALSPTQQIPYSLKAALMKGVAW